MPRWLSDNEEEMRAIPRIARHATMSYLVRRHRLGSRSAIVMTLNNMARMRRYPPPSLGVIVHGGDESR